jgi:hypothetical protein
MKRPLSVTILAGVYFRAEATRYFRDACIVRPDCGKDDVQ